MELWMVEETFLRTYLTNRQKFSMNGLTDGSILAKATIGKSIVAHDGDGHPHIYIDGILTPNGPDIIDMIMGIDGTSYSNIISELYDADEQLTDRNAPIFLHINSPGGSVTGAEATAYAVSDVASRRPVIAVNKGLMASAAMWIGASATRVLSLGRSTRTGSIGAIATAVKVDSDDVKIYDFVNPESPDKAPDPSTEEGAQVYINTVSDIYRIFRDDLVAGRDGRTSVEKIEALRGAAVTAEKALEAGLIDSIITDSKQINYTLAGSAGEDGSVPAGAQDREDNMNLSEFLKEHPAAMAELEARISRARSEGEKAAVDRHAEVVAKIKPIMDGAYPERVKTACADAISGTRSVESVLDLVAIFDEIKATSQSRASDEEQDEMPEIPSVGPEVKTRVDEAVKRDTEWNKAINGLLG